MRDSVSDLAFAAGWSAVRKMPEPAARALFNGLADQAWIRHGSGVQQLERNLRRVVPDATTKELRELSREGMRSYMRYWCEAFRLPNLSPQTIASTFHCYGEDVITDGLATGRGLILVLPHMGNWDHAGGWACVAQDPIVTVAERLKPESLYERFLDYRRALGMEVLPLSGGSGPFRVLLERAKQGRLICLLGDRDLTEHGVPVTFFGEATKMPAGPAALAIASGAILAPATLWHEDAADRNVCLIHPPIEVPATGTRADKVAAMTQRVADVFEQGIREHPTDWHMLQRLWLADLEPRPA